MAIERGELVVAVSKGKPPRIQVRIGKAVFSPAQGEVSQSVLDRLAELGGKEVEFERVGGQPKKVREVGGVFIPQQTATSVRSSGRNRPARGGFQQGRAPGPDAQREPDAPQQPRDFHNPYNFVPAPPRNTGDSDLGDQQPVDQDAFLGNRYSGSIHVKMVAKTPLLSPDTERAQESANGHKTFPLRMGADGKPLIPASSVRGMLRSAYESVTNSRFGRFSREQHGDRLAFRMDAPEGLRLIPARVQNGQIHLLPGTSSVGIDGRSGGPMYAAWLSRYWNGQIDRNALRYPDGDLPVHGDAVQCWIELFQHHRWDRRQRQHVADFQYWKVRQVVRTGEAIGNAPAVTPRENGHEERSWHQASGQPLKQVQGSVCVTNANINRKHDERVFFSDGVQVPGPFPVTDDLRRKWQELIQNYQAVHAEDLRRRRARHQQPQEYLGPEPGQTAWSRHVYTEAARELTDGTLCYARLNARQSDVEALFPVMIARELCPTAPWDLLHDSLRPAGGIDRLSPADRVFGWVKVDADTASRSKGERVAARGLVRVGPVRCESSVADAMDQFAEPGVPLAILAAPKPQQGRFYVARSPNGEAQRDGLSKQDAGYALGKGLRGRKTYPHQRSLPKGYWANPTQDRTQQAHGTPTHHQEYRRPRKDGQEQRDDQNRSILGWIKPGAEFAFDLNVHNLSCVELGALLWLLDLPESHFLCFGGGKPLGFGGARLTIASCDVRTGKDLLARYAAWCDDSSPSDPRKSATDAFKRALIRAYPQAGGFDDIPFIRAFLVSCRGNSDDLPTHYPRATDSGHPGPPNPDGESFKWFVANERNGAQHALADLASDPGLPTVPERAGGAGPGQQAKAQRRDRGRSGGGRGRT